jgi:hypothetical protein
MPASPRSPKTDTSKPGVPLAKLLSGAEAAGYAVEFKQAVSTHGGVNPTRVDLRFGSHFIQLLVYSWYITLEGKGRMKDDFRIQATCAHDGSLMNEPGRISVGVGLRLEDDLFVAFDAWAKRYRGASPSVHTRRAFIEGVKQSGFQVGGMRYDPRCGFDPSHVHDFLLWARGLSAVKTVGMVPAAWSWIGDDRVIVRGGIHARYATGRLRPKDRIVIFSNGKKIADPGLWQVVGLAGVEEKTKAGRPRWLIDFTCRRVGTVADLPPDIVDSLL